MLRQTRKPPSDFYFYAKSSTVSTFCHKNKNSFNSKKFECLNFQFKNCFYFRFVVQNIFYVRRFADCEWVTIIPNFLNKSIKSESWIDSVAALWFNANSDCFLAKTTFHKFHRHWMRFHICMFNANNWGDQWNLKINELPKWSKILIEDGKNQIWMKKFRTDLYYDWACGSNLKKKWV